MKMSKGFGIFCIILGVCCLMAAVGFVVCNHWEAENAQTASTDMLREVRESILEQLPEESGPAGNPLEIPHEMLTAKVDGYDCIGVLSIPVLELELPVLTDWSYAKLKVAPCHYFGSCYGPDFVIAAHNYRSHFGRLSALEPGDLVLFTDMGGTVYYYEVVLLETLPGNATEEMITSGFDLSLYTCTPGGASRVTVRCSAVNNNG